MMNFRIFITRYSLEVRWNLSKQKKLLKRNQGGQSTRYGKEETRTNITNFSFPPAFWCIQHIGTDFVNFFFSQWRVTCTTCQPVNFRNETWRLLQPQESPCQFNEKKCSWPDLCCTPVFAYSCVNISFPIDVSPMVTKPAALESVF